MTKGCCKGKHFILIRKKIFLKNVLTDVFFSKKTPLDYKFISLQYPSPFCSFVSQSQREN